MAKRIVSQGIAQAGSPASVTLAADAAPNTGAFDGLPIAIVVGGGAPKIATILTYDGVTKIAVLSASWGDGVDATSEYVILAEQPIAAYAVTARTSDDLVVGTWTGRGPGIPAAPSGHRTAEITKAEHGALGPLIGPGGVLRWSYPAGGPLALVNDTRPRLKFVPSVTDANVGDVGVTVTLEIRHWNTDALLNVNQQGYISLSDGRNLRVPFGTFTDATGEYTFTAGTSIVTVPTGKEYTASPIAMAPGGIIPQGYRLHDDSLDARVTVAATSMEPT